MPDLLNIGISGLNATMTQLVTTGNNISNASTPGYSRQEVDLQPSTPQYTGTGFLGSGVEVDAVKRDYSTFLTTQVQQATAESSQSSTYYNQIQQLDNMLGSTTSGLAPALQNFFSGVQTVANDPSDVPSRQALISSAQSMISTFQGMSQQITAMGQGLNNQIAASVTNINSYAQQLAQLNQSIVSAQGADGNNPPNSLLDQRDQVVQQLNQEVQGTVVKQSDGSYNIYIGNGIPLVVGNLAYSLTTMTSPTDPGSAEVGYGPPGKQVVLGTNSITGGNLGGVLQFRNNSLIPAQNALGQIAIGVASTFNAQNSLGQDLNGNIGGNIFTIPAPVVGVNSNNTGTGVVNAAITNAGALTTSDYSLSYNGANYQLTRLSDNSVTTFAAFPQTVDGVTLTLASGVIKPGDTFLISPTENGASGLAMATTDVSKIAAAAPILGSAGFSNTGSATISAGTVNGPPPVNANLQQPVTITFTGAGTFSVTGVGTGNPVGVAYTSGNNISYNGWTVQISGTPAAGDTFTVSPNTNGSADSRNALLLAGLQTQNTLNNGSATYEGAYDQLTSSVGNQTDELQVTSQAQQSMLTQAQASQQSVSGVNLDEEAANLIRFQESYQACGKMVQIADTCFQSLITAAQ
jgi:flagellar hook-associated protein 1 FlgK